MLPAANVTRGRGSGGARRLAAAVLLLALLALCCLARADDAASLGRASASEKGVASALENNALAREVERGHYTTLSAAEEEDDGPPVLKRVELEVIEDYQESTANNKHKPHP